MNPLRRVAFIGNHLPRRCGIATFTNHLHRAISSDRPDLLTGVVVMNDGDRSYDYPDRSWPGLGRTTGPLGRASGRGRPGGGRRPATAACPKRVGAAPIFRNRSGAPYSKDTLGDDFRAVRAKLFGRAETRQLADFRRSGAVEAISGDVAPSKLAAKMANTISASNRLHKTYSPAQLAHVRDVDDARRRGRARLREQKPTESVTTPAGKVSPSDS